MSHVSPRSYKKVASILDTIAKIKLCLLMLDLECDALVVDMFQSFLKMIDYVQPSTCCTFSHGNNYESGHK